MMPNGGMCSSAPSMMSSPGPQGPMPTGPDGQPDPRGYMMMSTASAMPVRLLVFIPILYRDWRLHAEARKVGDFFIELFDSILLLLLLAYISAKWCCFIERFAPFYKEIEEDSGTQRKKCVLKELSFCFINKRTKGMLLQYGMHGAEGSITPGAGGRGSAGPTVAASEPQMNSLLNGDEMKQSPASTHGGLNGGTPGTAGGPGNWSFLLYN